MIGRKPRGCAWALAALALVMQSHRAMAQEKVSYDFADAAQLADFKESPTAGANRYPHSSDPGVGIQPGKLASINRGEQGQTLHLAKTTYDITARPVSVSVKFQYGAGDGEANGTARILLVLSKSTVENLVSGLGKLGMRVFKSDAPKDPANPWIFQLVNGTSTRDMGLPFAMQAGHWYEMAGTFGATADGKTVSYKLQLRDLGADGGTSGQLQRGGEGKTPASTHYDVKKAVIGILGQNAGGGAVAFDDLVITSATGAAQDQAASAPLPEMTPVAFSPAPVDDDAQAPPRTIFGVVGHVMHTDSYYGPQSGKGETWSLPQTLPWLLGANLGWAREAMYQPWFANRERKDVDRHRADFETSLALYQKHGVKVVLAIMAVPPGDQWAKYNEPFFDYIADLTARFDCVRVVEMHNEPNLKFFWRGTPEEYVQTYRVAAERIKSRRPDVQIAVGSVSSLWWEPGVAWLDAIIAAGALQWADAVSVHPYNRTQPPEIDPHFGDAPADSPDHLDRALDEWWSHVSAAAPPGKALTLHLTELGYSSAAEGIAGLGEEESQADYLSRLMMIYLDARVRGIPIEGVFWYDLKDDGGKAELGEHNFGLIEHDLSRAKPAYHVYATIAGFFGDVSQLQHTTLAASFSNWPQAIKHCIWRRRADGAFIVPFWRLHQVQGSDRDADFAAIMTLPLPDSFIPARVWLHDLRGGKPRQIGFAHEGPAMRIAVNLDRRAAWLVIEPALARAANTGG